MSDHTAAHRGLRRWHPDPIVRSTISTIRSKGWAVTAVSGACDCGSPRCTPPACSFAYTSGMGLHVIPEMAVYGLDARTSCAVLNELGSLFHREDWRRVVDGRVVVSLQSLDVGVRVIEMIDKSDLLITNELFPDAPALQVVWPDDSGRFPWETDYSLPPAAQEIKGTADTGARATEPRVITSPAPNRAQRRAARRRF